MERLGDVNRKLVLKMAVIGTALVLAACQTEKDRSNFDRFNREFDSLLSIAQRENICDLSTRRPASNSIICEITYDEIGGDVGRLILEEGYRPSRLLGAFVEDESARTISLIPQSSETPSYLIASWDKDKLWQFTPGVYASKKDEENGIVIPKEITAETLDRFLMEVDFAFKYRTLLFRIMKKFEIGSN